MNVEKDVFFLRIMFGLLCITLVLFLILGMSVRACAGDRSIVTKTGDCQNMSAGWACYNQDGQKELDDAQKAGIQCKVDLRRCTVDLDTMKSGIQWIANQGAKTELQPKKFYQQKWFQITATSLAAFGVGMAIGGQF